MQAANARQRAVQRRRALPFCKRQTVLQAARAGPERFGSEGITIGL